MTRILVVEDDTKLRKLIEEYLTRYDYEVTHIISFRNVEKEILDAKPDLILLDINLPYLDGFYLCRFIRKKLTVPIIIASSRDSDMEQIMGIELGADDYIVKPFHLDLLLTKIKASLRRAYGEYSNSHLTTEETSGLILNPKNFRMTYFDQEFELSKNEFKLLKKLMDNKGCVVSREELLVELWDDQSFVEDNTLTVNITRLKAKLNDFGIHQAIKTIRGAGYLLDTELQEDKDE